MMMMMMLCMLLSVITVVAHANSRLDQVKVTGMEGWRPIGTGLSQGKLTNEEQVLFEHDVPGVMTHFWAAGSPVVDNVTMRYYVDNETEASIEFVASFATGVGFDDQEAYVFFLFRIHTPISSINSKIHTRTTDLGVRNGWAKAQRRRDGFTIFAFRSLRFV
jgi:hypothetical protein